MIECMACGETPEKLYLSGIGPFCEDCKVEIIKELSNSSLAFQSKEPQNH